MESSGGSGHAPGRVAAVGNGVTIPGGPRLARIVPAATDPKSSGGCRTDFSGAIDAIVSNSFEYGPKVAETWHTMTESGP